MNAPKATKCAKRLCAALVAFGSFRISAAAEQLLPPEAEFKTRSGIAEFASVEELLDNPTKLEMSISSWQIDGHYFIRSESDFHAIFPVPVEQVLRVLLDYEGTEKTYRRVRESALLASYGEEYDRHVVRLDVAIKVAGFGDEYVYVTNNFLERDEAGGYIQKFNLERSVDDKLYQMLGNWYVREIAYAGRRYTYVRQYAILGIQRGSFAMELAMKTFGALSLRQQFRQLSEATKRP